MELKTATRLKIAIKLDGYYDVPSSWGADGRTFLENEFRSKLAKTFSDYGWNLDNFKVIEIIDYKLGSFGQFGAWMSIKEFEVEIAISPGEGAKPLKIENGRFDSQETKTSGIFVSIIVIVGLALALIWSPVIAYIVVRKYWKKDREDVKQDIKDIFSYIVPAILSISILFLTFWLVRGEY